MSLFVFTCSYLTGSEDTSRLTNNCVGWAIRKEKFDSIFSEVAKKICGDAYGLAAIGCFRSIAQASANQVPLTSLRSGRSLSLRM